MTTKRNSSALRIGLVVPHIFMHRDILPGVIFSPGQLALSLVNGLIDAGADVTLFSPGPIDTPAANITADLSLFESELTTRGDTYIDLLRKHPLTFVTLARQVQAEIIAKAYAMANNDELDLVHIYTNEEDIALPFAEFCRKPVVFTHHDPFNFLVKHKNIFPKYSQLNWISISKSQRKGMPPGTNWVGNVYHGVDQQSFRPVSKPTLDYAAYFGRIVEQKGVHLAIAAVLKYNQTAPKPLKLKIAGKHYASYAKDIYWKTKIQPYIDDEIIQYVGHIAEPDAKRDFLANAAVTLMPSLFDEPFGMVAIESMACGTPVVGLDNGAIAESVKQRKGGLIVPHSDSEDEMVSAIAAAIIQCAELDRDVVRQHFLDNFTLDRMCSGYIEVYKALTKDLMTKQSE